MAVVIFPAVAKATMALLLAIAAVAACSSRSKLVGRWEVITDRRNCGWESGNSKDEIVFAPDGEYTQMFSSTLSDGSQLSSRSEGSWTTATFPSTLEIDVRKTTVPTGVIEARVVTTLQYEIRGDELRITTTKSKRYGDKAHPEVTDVPPAEQKSCAYRKTSRLE